jgi:hypothetical protein
MMDRHINDTTTLWLMFFLASVPVSRRCLVVPISTLIARALNRILILSNNKQQAQQLEHPKPSQEFRISTQHIAGKESTGTKNQVSHALASVCMRIVSLLSFLFLAFIFISH